MPSWNGINFFGPCPEMHHQDDPNAEQVTHYPGTRGVERIDLGLKTGWTTVRGVLCGATDFDLGNVLVTIRQAKVSGIVGTLIDTDGLTWPDAVVHEFQTVGRREYSGAWGWIREYEMKILHIGYDPGS